MRAAAAPCAYHASAFEADGCCDDGAPAGGDCADTRDLYRASGCCAAG